MSKGRKTIGKRIPAPGRIRLGDVLAIPLGDDWWGYIRILKDASCAILDVRSRGEVLSLANVVGSTAIDYRGYCEPWDHPTWVYVGKWRSEDEEDAWPPPRYTRDVLDPSILKIYHKGCFIERTRDERRVKGMKKGGLLFPGRLVEVIQACFEMKSDRSEIEKFAPFSSVWEPFETSNPRKSRRDADEQDVGTEE